MIRVQVKDGHGTTLIRRAQIISAGPPGTKMTSWARTCDDLPAAWLLVTEQQDRMTGKTEYTALAGNAGLG